MSKEVKD
ncbi:Protein of unknown function [Lactobacillus delbrueckii subsp. bulgaricus]|nr:Protein of unknown function [Lactobacillus delbrueckii subsp. bulgaricus]CDR75337.1 Protein of unknown function [Lactobacillus delbrueckii subsp. bulgaricus]